MFPDSSQIGTPNYSEDRACKMSDYFLKLTKISGNRRTLIRWWSLLIVQSSGSLWNRVIKQYKAGTPIKHCFWPVESQLKLWLGVPQGSADCNNVTLTDISVLTLCLNRTLWSNWSSFFDFFSKIGDLSNFNRLLMNFWNDTQMYFSSILVKFRV